MTGPIIIARDHHTGQPVELRVADHPANHASLLVGADTVLVLEPAQAALLAAELAYAVRRHFLSGGANVISATF